MHTLLSKTFLCSRRDHNYCVLLVCKKLPKETEAFGPRRRKELNPAKSLMNDSEADLPLVKLSDEITAPETAYLQPPRRP